MSGGSFNYISTKVDLEDVLGQLDDIDAMIGELRELGFKELADATEKWFSESGEQLTAMREMLEILQEAWYGVEWWRSADYSKDHAVANCINATIRLREKSI